MQKKALVVIDIQNDITKNYKEIIGNINRAIACVKSTCFNMRKSGYKVTVLSDCITSYDNRKIDVFL